MEEFDKLKINTWYQSFSHDGDGQEWINYFFSIGPTMEYFSIEVGNGEGYNGEVYLQKEGKEQFMEDIFEEYEFHELKGLDDFHRQMFILGAFGDHKDIE